jgi:hypothetical protein
LEALSNDISELKNHARVELRPSDVAPILALFCSILSAFLFTWLDWQPFFYGEKWDYSLQFLSISSPFFPALVMGLVLPRVRHYSSLLLGLVAGLAGEAQMLLLYAIGRVDAALHQALTENVQYNIPLPPHWYWTLVLYAIGGAVVFLCGTLLGQWLRHGVGDQAFPVPKRDRQLAGLKVALSTLGTFLTIIIPIVNRWIDVTGSTVKSQISK